MSKIACRVAKWVDSQTQLAQEMGIGLSTINSYMNGQRRLPLSRFIQIVHQAKPPQEDVDDIFNMYLEDLGLPTGAVRLLRAGAEVPGSPVEGAVLRDARIAKITELVMASEDISAEAKVAVYNIIQSTRKK